MEFQSPLSKFLSGGGPAPGGPAATGGTARPTSLYESTLSQQGAAALASSGVGGGGASSYAGGGSPSFAPSATMTNERYATPSAHRSGQYDFGGSTRAPQSPYGGGAAGGTPTVMLTGMSPGASPSAAQMEAAKTLLDSSQAQIENARSILSGDGAATYGATSVDEHGLPVDTQQYPLPGERPFWEKRPTSKKSSTYAVLHGVSNPNMDIVRSTRNDIIVETATETTRFGFDQVMESSCSAELYHSVVHEPMLEDLFSGVPAFILTIGDVRTLDWVLGCDTKQKGPRLAKSSPLHRTVRAILQHIDFGHKLSNAPFVPRRLFFSAFEIHNKAVTDLLTEKVLNVKESSSKGVTINDLTGARIEGSQNLKDALELALGNAKVRNGLLRSHVFIRLTLGATPPAGECDELRRSTVTATRGPLSRLELSVLPSCRQRIATFVPGDAAAKASIGSSVVPRDPRVDKAFEHTELYTTLDFAMLAGMEYPQQTRDYSVSRYSTAHMRSRAAPLSKEQEAINDGLKHMDGFLKWLAGGEVGKPYKYKKTALCQFVRDAVVSRARLSVVVHCTRARLDLKVSNWSLKAAHNYTRVNEWYAKQVAAGAFGDDQLNVFLKAAEVFALKARVASIKHAHDADERARRKRAKDRAKQESKLAQSVAGMPSSTAAGGGGGGGGKKGKSKAGKSKAGKSKVNRDLTFSGYSMPSSPPRSQQPSKLPSVAASSAARPSVPTHVPTGALASEIDELSGMLTREKKRADKYKSELEASKRKVGESKKGLEQKVGRLEQELRAKDAEIQRLYNLLDSTTREDIEDGSVARNMPGGARTTGIGFPASSVHGLSANISKLQEQVAVLAAGRSGEDGGEGTNDAELQAMSQLFEIISAQQSALSDMEYKLRLVHEQQQTGGAVVDGEGAKVAQWRELVNTERRGVYREFQHYLKQVNQLFEQLAPQAGATAVSLPLLAQMSQTHATLTNWLNHLEYDMKQIAKEGGKGAKKGAGKDTQAIQASFQPNFVAALSEMRDSFAGVLEKLKVEAGEDTDMLTSVHAMEFDIQTVTDHIAAIEAGTGTSSHDALKDMLLLLQDIKRIYFHQNGLIHYILSDEGDDDEGEGEGDDGMGELGELGGLGAPDVSYYAGDGASTLLSGSGVGF